MVQGTLGVSSSSAQGQQTLKVISGQKTTLFTQAATAGQASLLKLPDNTLKSVPAAPQLAKPGTTMLRVAGGVITAAPSPAVAFSANGAVHQSEGSTPVSSSVGSIIKTPGQPQVCVSQATMATCKGPAAVAGTAASLVSAPSSISGKATVSGLLKVHSAQSSPQQAVLTIPSQLKPLSINTSGGVQTVLMPVNKVVQSFSTSKLPTTVLPISVPNQAAPSSAPVAIAKVKTEPETPGPNCISQENQVAVKTEESSELSNYVIKVDHLETIQQLLTAVVKKIPLITAKGKTAPSSALC